MAGSLQKFGQCLQLHGEELRALILLQPKIAERPPQSQRSTCKSETPSINCIQI